MKKITKITTTLLSAILLCSCSSSPSADNPAPTQSSTISATETTSISSPDFIETQDIETSATSSPARPTQDFYSNLSLDGKEGLIITGDPLPTDKLTDFEYRLLDLEEGGWGALYRFVESLNMPEITDLCIRAQSLVYIYSTENLHINDELLNDDHTRKSEAQLDASSAGKSAYFVDSGVNFDSFAEAYLEVFTKNAVDRLFSWCYVYAGYNEQLWYVRAAMTGDVTIVHQEYELISKTESEILFRETEYCVELGEPLVYDPEKKDEYSTYTLDYKFVKTENGWRTDEFPVYDRTLDGNNPEYTYTSSISATATETTSISSPDFIETQETVISIANTAPVKQRDFYSDLILDDKEGIYVIGEPLPAEKLEKFDYSNSIRDINGENENPELYKFLQELNRPEITEVCTKSYTLAYIFSTDQLPVSKQVINNDHTYKKKCTTY